jgi:hypothetical protein
MKLKLILIIGALSTPAWGAIAFVQAVSANAGTHLVATSITATTGNLLYVGFAYNATQTSGCGTTTVSDGINTYTQIGSLVNNSIQCSGQWYAKNITGGKLSITGTAPAVDGGGVAITVMEFSGCDPTNPLDSLATAIGYNYTETTPLTITSSSFSTASTNEVVVASAANYFATTWSAGSVGPKAFTIPNGATTSGGTGGGNGTAEYYIASGPMSSVTASISNTVEVYGQISVAAFKAMITGCQINLQAIGPYTAGQTASNTFTASGCSASTYTISAGSLSGSGLSLNSSTGVLSGTAVAGSYAFTVAYGGATDPLSLTVNSPPSITSTTLPNAPTASPYAQTLATTGGTGIIACSLTSGSLAGSGLTLNSNCTVTGTAATVGTYTFTATPTDAVGVSGSGQSISLQVIASLLTTNGFQDFTLGSVKLEDFSLGARQTLGGTQLLTLVTAEDPNQSNFNIIGGQQGYMIDTGATEDTSGASDCTITSMATGCGLYIQFMPNNGIGTQNDYIFPGGFMQYYLMSGTWNSSLNRFRFRYTCDTQILPANGAINAGYLAGEPTNGGPQSILYIGSYIKPTTDSNPENQGQHYYHSLGGGVYPGHWTLVELNQHPNHQVGGGTTVQLPNDREWVDPTQGAPVHYYDGMTRWYIDTLRGVRSAFIGGTTQASPGAWEGVTCAVKDVWLDYSTAGASPDDLVSNITAVYNGAQSRYEIDWQAQQIDNTQFNVYYSSISMKTNGLSSGTLAGTATPPGTGYPGGTDTAIAISIPYNVSGEYFAIQPVSGSDSTICAYPCFTEVFVPAFDDATNCDLNGDGVYNVLDVQLAINQGLPDIQFYIDAALGKGCQ